VKYAASPTIRDRYGSTPIDDAIRHKHKPVVEFLATQSVATDLRSLYTDKCALSSEFFAAVFVKILCPIIACRMYMCTCYDMVRMVHGYFLTEIMMLVWPATDKQQNSSQHM
jgi:ankyrin repeat protein